MAEPMGGQIVGVDVGGTFTDLLLLDPHQRRLALAKTPTTPDNQAQAVLTALDQTGADAGRIDLIVHGTTTTTNAVLERRLAKTGLITTAGFRDVLELGRRTRPAPYGMTGTFTPLIPRNLRLEVPERMDADGNILIPLDEAAVRAAGRHLLDQGCEAVVVHFLHAYANPGHEQAAHDILAEFWPNPYITRAAALISESREFERGVTAAVNGAVQPLIQRYVDRLADALRDRGYRRDLLVMNGNGGMVSAGMVAREAAKTVMSGPASGVMAAAYVGRRAGRRDLLTYDMGGTSTDVALIRDATPGVSNEIELEYAMPIHVPMVDVRTVGAGGGSIARIDAAGLLSVGPESAGADPGPICYGRGGQEPTLSDANLLLGRLNPGRLNAVDTAPQLPEIARIFETRLGAALGTDALGAAAAVLRLGNAKMAGAIRMVSLSLGLDPRDFALFAFGGAGPLHASDLARELGIPEVLIPARPGMTNALGCVVADLRHDFVSTQNAPLDQVNIEALHHVIAGQIAEGRRLIAKEPIPLAEIRESHSADMQFQGQTHLLRVPLPDATPDRATLQSLFEAAYFARFQVRLPEIRANLVNINTSVTGIRPELDLSLLIDANGRKGTCDAAQNGTRRVWFAGGWVADVPIYWRDHLPLDAAFDGPAIIEQTDTTIVVTPGDRVTGDDDGNLLITVGARDD